MSRLNRQEVPGLIDSLRPGDQIVIDRPGDKPTAIHEFVKADRLFVYTKGNRSDSPRLWYRYAVLGRAQLKTLRLYTELDV